MMYCYVSYIPGLLFVVISHFYNKKGQFYMKGEMGGNMEDKEKAKKKKSE